MPSLLPKFSQCVFCTFSVVENEGASTLLSDDGYIIIRNYIFNIFMIFLGKKVKLSLHQAVEAHRLLTNPAELSRFSIPVGAHPNLSCSYAIIR